jgi:hypothetical protein
MPRNPTPSSRKKRRKGAPDGGTDAASAFLQQLDPEAAIRGVTSTTERSVTSGQGSPLAGFEAMTGPRQIVSIVPRLPPRSHAVAGGIFTRFAGSSDSGALATMI